MRLIKYLLGVIVTLFMSGCHDNEIENISWSEDALVIVREGINLNHNQAEVILSFTSIYSDVSVSSDESWIDVSLSLTDGVGELCVSVLENSEIFSRQGNVVVYSQGERIIIPITQEGVPNVIPEKDCYSHNYESGEIRVRVQSGSIPAAEIYPQNADWIKIKEIKAVNENEYDVFLILEKNEGLGRIASLDFKINGRPVIKGCGPCLIQEPAPFENKVEISVDKPGSLQILLGNNVGNLECIRSFKVVGPINGLDFPVIRSLFSEQENNNLQNPVSIDLSECSIVAGLGNPFEYYGWKPEKKYEEIFLYAEIPSGVFTNAVNVKEVVLPKSLKIVGASAFKGCKNLKQIKIPNSVEEINSMAFYGCVGMEEIQINADSNLSSIGNQAFTTGSLLKDLNIPITVMNVSSEAFLGCSVSRLHLKWLDPLEIKIVPKTEGCSLFVPQGTAELYRNTRNWCNFKEIIEE
ncbi:MULTISPECIES: leucine-rich repeat protein [unclassified Prevotella]|uniref:leucine-rich repeat protein n=1 Tax=unclassified Prevotella TaxID=2638335 RepID=UPI000B9689F5|nr:MULTISPECIES: leucine-rich repeat protein [unclassified Prevotella]OYP59320.1 hypothetical protein CIL02_11680 [Prevotella sp. P3-122]OYP68886.1 hypothetical protein CIK98_02545 [Prevotella sp. P2-180]